MKTILFLLLAFLLFACNRPSTTSDIKTSQQQIEALLDTLNATAARADFIAYFNCYTDDAVFMGTDATERWNKKEFMQWSKPFFQNGKAWKFTSLQRNLYFDGTGNFAWFDELLNTQMKICRGSGVVSKQGNDWKLKQYVLSITIPNALIDTIIPMKISEDSIIYRLKK